MAPDVYNDPSCYKPDDYSDVGQAEVLGKYFSRELRYSPATLVKSTLDLLRFAEKGVMLDVFDEALFENVVTRIRVLSRQKIVFELKCGLTLTERM